MVAMVKDAPDSFVELCSRAGVLPTRRQYNAYLRRTGAAYQCEMREKSAAMAEYHKEIARIEKQKKRSSLR